MKARLALFDFDGTLTEKDSLLEFIRFSFGVKRFYLGFLLNSPYLIVYKLKLISTQQAKERILTHFFKGMPEEAFDRLCQSFVENCLTGMIRTKGIEEIKRYQQSMTEVAIVSASPEKYIRIWAEKMGVECLATVLEVQNGIITGKISGANCNGPEKVRRILHRYPKDQFEIRIAYGDSSGDKEMFQLAHHHYLRPFR